MLKHVGAGRLLPRSTRAQYPRAVYQSSQVRIFSQLAARRGDAMPSGLRAASRLSPRVLRILTAAGIDVADQLVRDEEVVLAVDR